MIIICDKCNKKFKVKDNLIPKNGRLLKCGNCENSWFFKISNDADDLDDSKINKETINQNFENQIIINKNINKNTRSSVKKNNKEDFFKYFLNYFVVILILFISIIIVADTFKIQISLILPGIIPLLDNLYATLFDLQLFIKDLFN